MKFPTPRIRAICNVGTPLKTDIATFRKKDRSASSAFCDRRVLAAIVICLAGLTLVAFAVAPGKYSAGNTISVGNTNDAGAVANLHDVEPRTKSDRGGVALQALGWIPTGNLGTVREDHTATLLLSGKVLVVGGFGSSGSGTAILSSAELYDPATGSWSSTGSLGGARANHTATLLPSGKVLVAGGYGSNFDYSSSAELYDPATGSWSSTGSLAGARINHTATLLPSGKVLVTAGQSSPGTFFRNAQLYDPGTGSWSSTGSLHTARGFHTATLLPSGKVLVTGGAESSGYLSSAELYDPATESWSSTGSLLGMARGSHTATLLPSGKVLVAGGYNGSSGSTLSSAELYDPATGNWSSTGSLGTVRFRHTATLLPSGKLLVAGGGNSSGNNLSSAELYDPVTGSWSSAGSLGTARSRHTTTLLPSGKVLVAAGDGSNGSAELYDSAMGSWSSISSLSTARYSLTATLLPNGKVLAAGGWNSGYVRSAELYDPGSGTWTVTGSLNTARDWHTATLLPYGKVLVAGGNGPPSFDSLSSAELYDPASGSWTALTSSLNDRREEHTATLLPSGKVLVAGGYDQSPPNERYLSSAELYDPASGSWTATGSLNAARGIHTSTLLPNGKVLVAGGFNGGPINSAFVNSAELYDPGSGTWTVTGSLNTASYWHTATLLPNGKVLVAGGEGRDGYLSRTELYDPASGSWTPTGSLNTVRAGHTATLLPNGQVLVAGGSMGISYLSSTELYDPASGSWTLTASLNTRREGHRAALLPNGKVLVAGGYNGQDLNSAELYDPGLGFNPAWQPLLTTVLPSILPNGSALTASGSRFKGISEASGGNGAQNSSSNYPLVQLLSLTNEQTLFLPVDAMAGWSDTSFTSTPVILMTNSASGFPIGYALVTVFTNGVPSQSQFVVMGTPTSPTECEVCHKHTTTLTLPCGSLEYHRHLDHGDTVGACPTK